MTEGEAWVRVWRVAGGAGLSEREARAAFRSGWQAGCQAPADVFDRPDRLPTPRRIPPPVPVTHASVAIPDEVRPVLRDVWHVVCLAEDDGDQRRRDAWLRSRGLSSPPARRAIVDVAARMDVLVTVLRDQADAAERAGLWSPSERDGGRLWFPLAQRIPGALCPVWHPEWEEAPVSYRHRCYRPYGAQRQKSIATRGAGAAWMRWPLGVHGPRTHVTEGEPDWLTLWSVTGTQPLGCLGSHWLPHWSTLLGGSHPITVCAHHDDPGVQLARRIVGCVADMDGGAVARDRVRVRVPSEPSRDWNDVYQESGKRGVLCELN